MRHLAPETHEIASLATQVAKISQFRRTIPLERGQGDKHSARMFKIFFIFPRQINRSLGTPYHALLTNPHSIKEYKRKKNMCFPASFPRLLGLRASLVASLALLASGAVYAQNSDSGDVSALKSQMEKMQKQYEDRISAMESKMQSLESKADSGSILNTHVLTDADGKQYEGKGPVLDESFLKSLTRNFSFTAYVRAGVQFNGNGGGGNFSFNAPDNDGGRPRLGNEQDVYMELTWKQAHMLGDNPDVMDVSMTFTPAIVYQTTRNSFTVAPGSGSSAPAGVQYAGNDFRFVLREAYLEMANVFKGAPEITFWGGERFYDRFNVDSNDYFYLDDSGYGAGVRNIDVGIGKLWLAYIASQDNHAFSTSTGTLYKHGIDVRLKDIQLGGFGKLMLIFLANQEKGTTFTRTYDNFGNVINLANPVKFGDSYGFGGGFVYQYDFCNKSFLQLWGLFGRGATTFSNVGTDFGTITGAETNFLTLHPAAIGQTIGVGHVIDRQMQFRAGGQFVWNPTSYFSMCLWGFWNLNDQGFQQVGTDINGHRKIVSGNRNLVEYGIRPVFWIADNIAIQGQAWGAWEDNNRGGSGTRSFGHGGNVGVFTIAPTIKPKGGFYTRPELRVFATYSVWSDSFRNAGNNANIVGTTQGPYVNARTNDGWLFGTQVEWYF
jgi:maltoporin